MRKVIGGQPGVRTKRNQEKHILFRRQIQYLLLYTYKGDHCEGEILVIRLKLLFTYQAICSRRSLLS